MKYLLKQHIHRKTKDDKTKVYPGNPGLIKLAKELQIHYETIPTFQGEHFITGSYIFDTKDYKILLEKYSEYINKKRDEFYAQDNIIQLIKLLKYIFKRNSDAKTVERYSASINAYDNKNEFLQMALKIAQSIPYHFFKWGYDRDPSNSLHYYIYYFEIEGLGQLSFHSEELFPGVPIFWGKWIGIKNERFPFNLKDIKKLIKKEVCEK